MITLQRAIVYDENEAVFSIFVEFIIALAVEATLYTNHRSKVKLFMQAKIELLQQD